jgi:hypothetical protein
MPKDECRFKLIISMGHIERRDYVGKKIHIFDE